MKRSWIPAAAMVFGWLVLVACSEIPRTSVNPLARPPRKLGNRTVGSCSPAPILRRGARE
jgi:hypothetical protein